MSPRLVILWAFTVLLFLFLGQFGCLEAKSLGVTIDLIHRDYSPLSPFYDPTKTTMARYQDALRWSKYRSLTLLSSNRTSVGSQVVADNGGYLINFSIGSPPIQYYGALDTGSDLTWIQCTPCIACFKQKFPLFNPNKSTTYKSLPCTSQQCQGLQHKCSCQNTCEYTYGYAGGGYTIGSLSNETLTLTNSISGQPSPYENIVFGCGFNNSGMSDNETGIFGLGGGPLSMVSQIGSRLGSIKFSHCLVPFHTSPSISSKLIIGVDVNADDEDKSVISTTPLVPKDQTLYFVTLEGLSVGEKFIPFNAPGGNLEKGNMLIDSGTTNVILPQDLFQRVEDEVMSQITIKPIEERRPALCYHSESEITTPVITAHFDGGANVRFNPSNIFIQVEDGVYCFTIVNDPTSQEGTLGNFGQFDFSMGFDLEKRTVSFKPTDCTKNH